MAGEVHPMLVTLPPEYRPTEDEAFMSTLQLEYFRQKVIRWRHELLREAGETLTSLIETAMRETIARRRTQDEFLARGLRAAQDAKQTGIYYTAEAVHDELAQRLDARRKQVLG